jgi:eukaryotic-like serine/threonine-protein kinase
MKSIGKYQVIEQLGASAAGTTYRVRDSFRNREFALKVLQTVPGLTPAAKEQLCGHLANCAELAHRHVIKVQDMGEVEEGLFVVSEWRTGMDLQWFMQQNRELPLGQKLALVAQVAEGLAFAHSREIAHGDLKPSNVFVDGERDITILDFGIAKWLAALLQAGIRPEALVANYLAPEQVLGQPFDARSDIFALGLMMYEFLAGKYPFAAEPGLIPREIVHTEATPLRKLDPEIPEELDQLVQRAMRKDPAERLQTAEEFAAGLYQAAQELRRRASAVAPTAPPVTAVPFVEMPTAFRDMGVNNTPVAVPALVAPELVAAPSVAPAAVIQEPPQPAIEMPAPVQAAPAPVVEAPAAPPVQSKPTPVRKPAAPQQLKTMAPPKSSKKRVLVAAAGLILAAVIIGSSVSRQGLHASQSKPPAVPVAHPAAIAPPADPPTDSPQATPAAKPGESGPNDVGNPEFSAKQTLNGPVRTLWESGRYSEALALVNQVLANNPNNAAALAWKKKVRDAQQAEAALK